ARHGRRLQRDGRVHPRPHPPRPVCTRHRRLHLVACAPGSPGGRLPLTPARPGTSTRTASDTCVPTKGLPDMTIEPPKERTTAGPQDLGTDGGVVEALLKMRRFLK